MYTNNFSNMFNQKPVFIISNTEAIDYIGCHVTNITTVCAKVKLRIKNNISSFETFETIEFEKFFFTLFSLFTVASITRMGY